MLYLDTHAVVWLYAGEGERFTAAGKELIEHHELFISPFVLLELQYLKEIGRISADPGVIFQSLSAAIGLRLCEQSMLIVVTEAMVQSWTRDPFDRLIAAQAIANRSHLLTKDQSILAHCPLACW